MLVMVVFFIAFRWIHLSTPLIRLFLLVLILLLMPTLNFLAVLVALTLLLLDVHKANQRGEKCSAGMRSNLSTKAEEPFSRNARPDRVCERPDSDHQ